MRRLLFVSVLLLLGAGCASPERPPSQGGQQGVAEPAVPVSIHLSTPAEVRGLYWTASTAGGARGDELLSYMEETGLNAVVIDLKMDDGELAFVPLDESLKPYALEKPAIADLEGLLAKLKAAGIYRIARVAVMRDAAFASVHPELAFTRAGGTLWRDNTGMAWVDPAAPEVAAYAVALGEEAYERGFDEIQYDYVRFASDGALSAIRYPVYDGKRTKSEVMQAFFRAVGGGMMERGIPVSFDLFGMTLESMDDFNIGQRLVDAYPYADYLSPMTYPSHYEAGFQGYKNPALFPYEVPKHSFDAGKAMLEKELGVAQAAGASWLRPWIQDFDIGAVYTAERIEAQIKAARDAGASGWLLWNARNVYEPARYLPDASE